MTFKTKPLKVPDDFYKWMDVLSDDFSKQTGLRKSKIAAMRRLTRLQPYIKVKGTEFEIVK